MLPTNLSVNERASSAARLALLMGLAVGLTAASPATADEDFNPDPVNRVLVGGQLVDVDTDDDSDNEGKFDDQQDHPEGIVLDYLNWTTNSANGMNWLQISLLDLLQEDQQHSLRADLGNHVRIRIDGFASRNVYGDEAVSLHDSPSPGELRIPDSMQSLFEDPNGDGIIADAADDLLLPPLVYDALSVLDPFRLETERDRNTFSMRWMPLEHWSIDVGYTHDSRSGRRPFGTGTYSRPTAGDDYWFVVRGSELAVPVDWETDDFRIGTSYWTKHWFGSLDFTASRFRNDVNSVTYDNPFFYTDIDANSGGKRGRWEQGRVALEPDNDAWDLALTTGFRLARSTQFTLMLSQGELTQDDSFIPLTPNTALIGTADIDGNGVVNALDDPTNAATLPASSLDGKAKTSVLGFTFSSRPADWVQVNARYRNYDYDSRQDRIVFPFRADYIESHLTGTAGGSPIISEPFDYSRETWGVDAVFRPHESIGVKPFYGHVETDRDRYVDDSGDGHVDGGTRAVSSNSEDKVGLALMFQAGDKFDGTASYADLSRRYPGDYVAHWGDDEREGLEHWDLAESDGTVWDLDLNFTPTDASHIGAHYQAADMDFNDVEYGLLGTSDTSYGVDFGITAGIVTVAAYWEHADSDFDTFLRTKCANCAVGAPWDVPTYDWESNIDDSWDTYGLSLVFAINDKTTLSVKADISDATSSTRSENPDPPATEVATAYDFPDVDTRFDEYEVEFERKVSDTWGFLLRYTFQSYDQEFFAQDDLTPYALDSIAVDNGLRQLFLNSKFDDYDAHIFEFLFSLTF